MGLSISNLSSNVVLALKQIMTNQTICKYLYYTDTNPLSNADIANTKDLLLFKNLFPFPFDQNIKDSQTIEIRVYYYDIKYGTNLVIADSILVFDIMIPKANYLVKNASGLDGVRPYEIAEEITKEFSGKSIGTLGIIHFLKAGCIGGVNDNYDCFRLTGQTMSVGQTV